jgi:hypothetical protein
MFKFQNEEGENSEEAEQLVNAAMIASTYEEDVKF